MLHADEVPEAGVDVHVEREPDEGRRDRRQGQVDVQLLVVLHQPLVYCHLEIEYM